MNSTTTDEHVISYRVATYLSTCSLMTHATEVLRATAMKNRHRNTQMPSSLNQHRNTACVFICSQFSLIKH